MTGQVIDGAAWARARLAFLRSRLDGATDDAEREALRAEIAALSAEQRGARLPRLLRSLGRAWRCS